MRISLIIGKLTFTYFRKNTSLTLANVDSQWLMEQPILKKDNWDDQSNYVCQLIINPEVQCGPADNMNFLIMMLRKVMQSVPVGISLWKTGLFKPALYLHIAENKPNYLQKKKKPATNCGYRLRLRSHLGCRLLLA